METKIAVTKDVPSGQMIGIDNHGTKILVANLNGHYYAIGNKCTHRGCTLSDGTLNGEIVQCPCHGSNFDVRSGAVVKGPAKKPEPSFNLQLKGEEIHLSA